MALSMTDIFFDRKEHFIKEAITRIVSKYDSPVGF